MHEKRARMLRGAGKISWIRLRNWQPEIHAAGPAAPAETLGRYAVAVGITALALLFRLWLDPFLHEHYAFSTFVLATIIVNWWCGTGPAVLTTVLGLLAGMWFFLPPHGTLLVSGVDNWIGVGIYLVVGLVISGLGWIMRQAHAQLAQNMREVAEHRAALAREVQERKQAEAALRQSEQRFHAFVNSNVIGILVLNLRTGEVYEANDAFLSLIGRPRQELSAGRLNIADVTAPEYAHVKEEAYRQALRGQPIHPCEKEYLRPDGTRVCALLGGVALGPDRETAMTFVLDMTERKRLERELREQEEEFRTAFQLSAVGQAQASLVSGRLQRVNSRLCEMTGYSEPELLDMNFIALVHPQERGSCWDNFNRVVRGEVPHLETECRYLRKDGSFISVVVAAALIRDASGQPVRVTAAINDVTQRKQDQLALQAAQEELNRYTEDLEQRVEERTAELRQSFKSMQEFTYTIAHDLRAPLRATHSFATLLLQNYATNLDREGRDFTERIVEAALRMDNLIGDLLEYGRVVSADVRLGPVDTQRVVSGVVREAQTAEAAARVQIEIIPPLPPVLANAALLSKTVGHLVQNALKFMAPGVTPRVQIRAEPLEGWVRLKVCDNGIGIAPEFHGEIFRAFQRLAPAQGVGTGMGLAIVQKAVERMRGRVGLESEPGKGSCFWVELPQAA